MDHITIAIPDGLDADQKADLTGWLSGLAQQVAAPVPSFDEDAAAEISRRIRRGLADADAGRVSNSREAMRRVAAEHGLNVPA